MITFTGILTALFVVLAATNGIKRHIKNKAFIKIISYHYLYGALALVFALTHGTLNILEGNLRLTGTVALVLVLLTATLGGTFKQLKTKKLFLWHKAVGPLAILAIVVHIIFNSSF
jgi:hypothetical protein